MRDRIFANINHEIRTPLTLVQLAVSDVKRHSGAALDARSLRQLDGIEMSTRKLLRLVDDLLLLASGREGKLRLSVTAVDLSTLLELVVTAWRPAAEQRGLSIAFQGPKRCIRHVDEEKIERVVTNLISNAHQVHAVGRLAPGRPHRGRRRRRHRRARHRHRHRR